MRIFIVWGIIICCVVGGYFVFGNQETDTVKNNLLQEKVAENIDNTNSAGMNKKVVDKKRIMNISDIKREMKGERVVAVGYVVDVIDKGHIFATFKDVNKKEYLKVVLFEGSVDKLPERKQLLIDCEDRKIPVYVEGKVDIYRNELEIVAFKVYVK